MVRYIYAQHHIIHKEINTWMRGKRINNGNYLETRFAPRSALDTAYNGRYSVRNACVTSNTQPRNGPPPSIFTRMRRLITATAEINGQKEKEREREKWQCAYTQIMKQPTWAPVFTARERMLRTNRDCDNIKPAPVCTYANAPPCRERRFYFSPLSHCRVAIVFPLADTVTASPIFP